LTPEKIEEHIVETRALLARMDAKLALLCSRTSKTNEKVDALPCEEHTKAMMKEVANRVPWRIFMGIISIIAAIILTSFAYTTSVSNHIHAHEISTYYHQIPDEMEEP
jgi:hypothetical protein